MMKNESERKKKVRRIRILIGVCAFLICIPTAFLIVRGIGKKSLRAEAGKQITNIGKTEEDNKNQVFYKDCLYEWNEDIISILVMGIDKETVKEVGGQSWSAAEGSGYAGGQADALFLVVLNPHKETVSVIAINRNTMAEIDVFDEEGNYQGVYTQQIALQHGYGDGGTISCERQVKAVSRMLHDIPIQAYAAVSMDAIPEMNDAIGGVTVEVLDDIVYPEYDMELYQGDTVTLHGEEAYWYVRLRDENAFNSNELRLQRQKQYLTTFAAEVKSQTLSDMQVPIVLYEILEKYMVTDIDFYRFTYLASEAGEYDFDINNMYSLQGEVIQGNQFEEFYLDEEALEDLLIEIFYEPVGPLDGPDK